MLFEPNEQGLILGQNPVTLGHEGTGFVVETGSSVSGFKPGDKVGFIPAIDCCYECHPCKNVHNVYCVTGNQKMQGFAKDGYFQEYAVVDARSAMILPDSLDPYTSAPLFCAGLTAFHAVEDSELKPGQWAAIIGCGGLGHLVSCATLHHDYVQIND
jgi:alcohol dehydrogenase, propanol-preferring